MAFLEGNSMTAGYGSGPDIINSCSINVNKGEIVAILGPNGAGKSTAMKAMLGLLKLKSGSVIIDGKDISSLSPQDRVKSGISFVPQTKNVLPGLTVKEILEIGAFLRNEDLNKIIEEIRKIYDPELPVNIYELGLIYDIKVDGRKAEIKMTLTTPNCPVAESLPKEVKEGAMQVDEIDEVDLQLVWDPPWTKDMMSDAAKLELNL